MLSLLTIQLVSGGSNKLQGETNECENVNLCASFPCLDLREGDNHHHIMSYVEAGKSLVKYYDKDWKPGKEFSCTCSEYKPDSFVGIWSCPSFYGGSVTISNDFGDDFTSIRENDHIDVCVNDGMLGSYRII